MKKYIMLLFLSTSLVIPFSQVLAHATLPIESVLVEEIFEPRWKLNTQESQLLLSKLQLAQMRPDYEMILSNLYQTAKNLKPKPFDPTLWKDAEDATAIEPTHIILMENSCVRILEVIMPPGCTQVYHTHKWAGILVDIVSSDFMLYSNNEEIRLYATDDPVFHHTEGQPLHSTKNIGDATYVGLHIEIKK